MLHSLAVACCLLIPLAAQCQIQGITLSPNGAGCSGPPPLNVTFSSGACSILFAHLPFPGNSIPYGTWLALGLNGQQVSHALVVPGCLLLRSPDVILPMGWFVQVPIPPGITPFSFHADAYSLMYEPNTGVWFVLPAQQGWQVVLY